LLIAFAGRAIFFPSHRALFAALVAAPTHALLLSPHYRYTHRIHVSFWFFIRTLKV